MHGLTGKYRLDARLGSGGMAEVFVASTVGAEGFSRKVAIKRILAGFSENPAFAQMFIAEAQISSQLQHPNIVSVLDFDRDADNRLYMVMELVEGKDLDGLSGTGPLPFSVVIHVISEVLRGLGYAHNLPGSADGEMRGLVHRDVSPHNVLVSWEGAVKVSDFGIAKARAASNATASMFIKGKPQYMSPEQANGQPLDGRSDLFAVGVMLWEMLTGQRLFVGNTTQEVLARMLFAPIAWPRQIRPEIPVDLERIAMRLLERNLHARYATAEDAIADLLACRAAPRGGRDELVAALAERFPGQAPKRSLRRSAVPSGEYQGSPTSAYAGAVPIPARPGTPASPTATTARGGGGGLPTPNAVPIVVVPTAVPAHAGTTVRASAPDHPVAPIATPVMAAETRTIAPDKPATRVPLPVWIVSGAVVTLLIVLIVVTRGGAKNSGAGSGSGSSSVSGSAIARVDTPDAPPPPPPDAAPAPPDAPPVPPDAPPAARKDARTGSHAPSGDGCTFDRSAAATATIKVTVDPYAIVTIDNDGVGQTPVQKKVPPGCHVVKIENAGLDKSERRKVELEAGQTRTVNADWR